MVQNKVERVSWKDDTVAQAHIAWPEPVAQFEAGSEQVLYETRAMAKALSSWMAYSKAKRKAIDKCVLNWHREAADLKRRKDLEMICSEAAVAHVPRLSGHWLRAERERLLPGLAAVHKELIAAVLKFQAARVVKLKSGCTEAKLVVDCIAAGERMAMMSEPAMDAPVADASAAISAVLAGPMQAEARLEAKRQAAAARKAKMLRQQATRDCAIARHEQRLASAEAKAARERKQRASAQAVAVAAARDKRKEAIAAQAAVLHEAALRRSLSLRGGGCALLGRASYTR